MARYGKLETGFWHNPKIRRLSQEATFLLLYLLSCPHGNAVGCFVLHDGYIAVDLRWPAEAAADSVQELIENDLIERDPGTFLLRILGWWGHNSIENANVAKHALKEIAALPACDVKYRLIKAVMALDGLHPAVRETLSTGLRNPSQNPSETVSEPFAEPFLNQEPSPTDPNQAEHVAPAGVAALAAELEKPKKRGSRIDSGWRPNDQDHEFARSRGFSDAEIDAVADNFVDYWIAKSGANAVKRNWSATWRYWLRNERQQPKRSVIRPAQATPSSIDWDQFVADYRASDGSRWPARRLGPEPGYAGCRAPASILEKHGFGRQEVATPGASAA
jgi:hypothetical protein